MTPFEKLLMLCEYLDLDAASEKTSKGYEVCIKHYRGSMFRDSIKRAIAPSVDEAAQVILNDMKEIVKVVFE